MDSVSRLIRLVRYVTLGLLLVVLAPAAFASGVVNPVTKELVYYGLFGEFSTAAAWCARGVAVMDSSFTYTVKYCPSPPPGADELACFNKFQNGQNVGERCETIRAGYREAYCPAGSSGQPPSCVCNDPLVPNDAKTACVPPPGKCESLKGKPFGSGEYSVTVSSSAPAPSEACLGGCAFTLPGYSFAAKYGTKADYIFDAGKSKGTGAECVPSQGGVPPEPGETPQPKPDPLPPGKCPGTVNGTPVVVPCDSTTAPGPKETQKPPETTAPPASGASAPSAPGTTETSSETTCTGTTCKTTTTETVTNPDGSQTTTEKDREESKDEYCQKNPSALQCKDRESQFGGSCGAFTCGGDAIQCAIAREQHARNCQLFERSDASDRGLAAAAAGDRPGDHPANSPATLSLANGFDQTNLMSGGCPGDMSIKVGSRSVVLPFSDLCGPAAMLGNVLVGITALACLGIVFRG